MLTSVRTPIPAPTSAVIVDAPPRRSKRAVYALWLHATPRNALLAFTALAALLLGENLLDVPPGVPYMRRVTGGQNFLDFGFTSPTGAHVLLERFGPAGRHVQGLLLASVDVFVPLASGIFGSLALVALGRSLFGKPGRWLAFAFVPIGAMLFDYAENASIAGLLLTFPHDARWLSVLTHWLTAGKFLLYQGTAFLVALGCVAAPLTARTRRRSPG